jgi:signal transduction histidine kinase/ActR/RegA family two-component response regulator
MQGSDPCLSGGGTMGALMRATDWSNTAFGAPDQWSHGLRFAVSLILNNSFPMAICWGADLRLLYNDAYRPILGIKHPQALGRPVSMVFPEIWDVVGPLLMVPLSSGQASFLNQTLLAIDREGFIEETYFFASYSPIFEEARIAGVLVTCHETTEQVQSERRLRTLRDLAAQSGGTENVGDVCRRSLEILGTNATDIPFALLYLLEDDGRRAHLISHTGLQKRDNGYMPEWIALNDESIETWPLRDKGRTERSILVDNLASRFGRVLGKTPSAPIDRALVTTLERSTEEGAVGFLITGLNPRVRPNKSYRGFVELAADEIFGALEKLRSRERERRRGDTLARLGRAKDNFVAVLGHELRNPLAPISSALRSMQLKGSDLFQPERAIIERQVRHLTRLVDDLLDVSRIVRGKINFQPQAIEIAEVVDAALEAAAPLIEERQHHLSVTLARNGMAVEADPFRLSQVVSNLLTNAAKYTEPGGHISLQCRRESEEIVIMIKDDGIGISAEEMPHIFDFFEQGPAVDRLSSGLGLGLTIVKNLTKLHGGVVEVASDGPGCGSEFIIRLPASERLPNQPAPTPRLEECDSLDQKRVFIVDDNEDAAAALSAMLHLSGYVTATAPDAPSALALVTQFKPDIMLIDIGLPAIDGYELATRLRAMPDLGAVRLVAVTGYAEEADRLRAIASGFDEHLVKPLNITLLENVLRGDKLDIAR